MMLIGAAAALVTDLRCHFESLKMTPQEAPLGDGTGTEFCHQHHVAASDCILHSTFTRPE